MSQLPLSLLASGHLNGLIVAPDPLRGRLVDALRWHVPRPVSTAYSTLLLPPPDRSGTVILPDVNFLSGDGQRRLMAWLDFTGGRTQVIATAAFPVWPLVTAGVFLEPLYYRLNAVHIDATPWVAPMMRAPIVRAEVAGSVDGVYLEVASGASSSAA